MTDQEKAIWDATRDSIEAMLPDILKFARVHSLSVSLPEPGPDSYKGFENTSWSMLDVDQDRSDPSPRTQLRVTLRKADALCYVWCYVEDAKTERRVVDIAWDNLTIPDMPSKLWTAMAKMGEAVRANMTVDAAAERRKRDGTKYDWTYEVDDGLGFWMASVSDDITLSFYPEMSEGAIDREGECYELSIDTTDTAEALRMVEAEYARRFPEG